MKIYLDNCCFNRPYDDQLQLRIRLETEAKLQIQSDIRAGNHELVWSYMLDYENGRNPFQERKDRIATWRDYASSFMAGTDEVLEIASAVQDNGVKKLDALHIACAMYANADFFITTDDGIIKKTKSIQTLRVVDPIDFIKELSL
ncbi:MAG: PIN domain protein [Thiolinea sp.]